MVWGGGVPAQGFGFKPAGLHCGCMRRASGGVCGFGHPKPPNP